METMLRHKWERYNTWARRLRNSNDPAVRGTAQRVVDEISKELRNEAVTMLARHSNEDAGVFKLSNAEGMHRIDYHLNPRYSMMTRDEDTSLFYFRYRDVDEWLPLGYQDGQGGWALHRPDTLDGYREALQARVNRAITGSTDGYLAGFNAQLRAADNRDRTRFNADMTPRISARQTWHEPRTDHVHMAVSAVDRNVFAEQARKLMGGVATTSVKIGDKEIMINTGTNPADLRAAASHALAEAAKIEAFDAREPQGDEPVITWVHQFPHIDRTWTYVAFKANGDKGSDRWYVTGERTRREGYTWRELGAEPFAAALRNEGDHRDSLFIVTGWGAVNDNEGGE